MDSCCSHQREDAFFQLAKTWCIRNTSLRHRHGLYLSCIVFICFQRSILLVKACADALVVATRICISSLLLVSVSFHVLYFLCKSMQRSAYNTGQRFARQRRVLLLVMLLKRRSQFFRRLSMSEQRHLDE